MRLERILVRISLRRAVSETGVTVVNLADTNRRVIALQL